MAEIDATGREIEALVAVAEERGRLLETVLGRAGELDADQARRLVEQHEELVAWAKRLRDATVRELSAVRVARAKIRARVAAPGRPLLASQRA